MRRRLVRRRSVLAVATAAVLIGAPSALASGKGPVKSFKPLANWNVPGGGVAEIVAATPDGKTLYYTDSSAGAVGVVDISRPKRPNQLKTIEVGGEPTSVAVTKDGAYAVVAVQTATLNEGEPPVLTPGKVVVIDLASMGIAKEIELAGGAAGAGPDSIATGEYGGSQFAVVALENEPVIVDGDGNLTDGEDPGDPGDVSEPGNVQVIDLGSDAVFKVDLPEEPSLLFPDDPQPEYVDVSDRYAVVSLQENNGMAVIDAAEALAGNPAGAVKEIFSTGTASERITDLVEDEVIDFKDAYPSSVAGEDNAGARTADAVAFTADGKRILSADEGEQNFTGGRGWSMWRPDGTPIRDDKGALEDESLLIGQFPEDRAENKGIEVEGIEVGTFGGREYWFAGSERGSFVGVYRARKNGPPRLVQTLPTGVGPEGLLAIPSANLLVTADEVSGNLSIFKGISSMYKGTKKRPLLRARSDEDGFAAISGLSGDPRSAKRLWGVPDSAIKSELYRINLNGTKARLSTRPVTKDGVQQAYDLEGITADTSIEGVRTKRADDHRRAQRRARAKYVSANRNGNAKVAASAQRLMTYHGSQAKRFYRGGFWLAQEGNADFGDSGYRPNLLIQVNRRGEVQQEIPLPPSIDSPAGGVIRGNGFEGVAVSDDGRKLVAVIQREYADEPEVGGRLHTRIARYDLATQEWEFFLYPLDTPPEDEWVGLSEIVNLGGDRYAVIERDNQQGGAAETKRIYQLTLDDVEPTDGSPLPPGTTPEDAAGRVIKKAWYADVKDEFAPFEKIEGLALAGYGRHRVLWGNVDNDGGGHESRLIKLGKVKPAPDPRTTLTLSVLHHNDGESELLPDAADGLGGVARFGRKVQDAKAEAYSEYGKPGRRTEIMVSAGDNFLPGPELNASLSLPPGSPFYDAIAYDLIGYDGITIGNHDLDLGPDVLEAFIRSFQRKTSGSPARKIVPFLSANLDVTPEPSLTELAAQGRIAKSTIAKVRGYKVGIIGATTPNLPFISTPREIIVDTMVAPAIQREIDRLRAKGVNKIVLSSHLQGVAEDEAIVGQLEGLDAAIAGGGDELLANPSDELLAGDTADPERPYPIIVKDKTGKDVPLVTGPGQYKYLGRLIIEFDQYGELVMIDPDSGPIANFPEGSGKEVPPRADIQTQVVDPVAESVAALEANVLGTATVELEGEADDVRSRETNLGNFTADAILDKAVELAPGAGSSVDVAIQNGGGIRESVPAGPFTEAKTFGIFPFGNTLTIVEDVSPAELKEILENAVSKVVVVGGEVVRQGGGTGRFAQVAGMTYSYDPTAQPRTFDVDGNVTNPGARLIDVALADGTPLITGGVPVGGAPSINIAINSFNAGGGDQYPVLPDKNKIGLGLSTQQALAEYVTEQSPIGASPYDPPANLRIFPIFS